MVVCAGMASRSKLCCCCVQAALLLCGSMSGALPVASAAYMVVCFVWLNATVGLGRDMAGQEEGQMVSSRD